MPRNRRILSRADRQGLYFLVGLLLCFVAFRLFTYHRAPPESVALTSQEVVEMAALDSEAKMSSSAGGDSMVVTKMFRFNPNTADSLTLRRLGLSWWQVRNMMKYRRVGGRWRSADDFSRLYGLTAEEFARLRPYIVIPQESKTRDSVAASRRSDTVRWQRVEKYPVGTQVDLNAADTTELKHIPGIGSYRAAKICRYRERLGGFVAVAQLSEIDDLPNDIVNWAKVDVAPAVRRLNVNTATFQELVRHPYLSYEQVKALVDYRRKYGRIRALDDLKLTDVFTPADATRLAPYLAY